MTPEAGWRRLAAELAARSAPLALLADRPRSGGLAIEAGWPAALRIAAAVIEDRPGDALPEPAGDAAARRWRVIALRRAALFPEARRLARTQGAQAEERRLYEAALAILRAGGPGFRWAMEAAAQLAARGGWDPVWFVDACAAVHAGLLSRETAALLEQIQHVEIELLLEAGMAVPGSDPDDDYSSSSISPPATSSVSNSSTAVM